MKKLFALVVLGIVALGLLVWVGKYLSTGKIIITTSDKNSTIVLQNAGQDTPFNKISIGSLSVTVPHGQYTATVKNGSRTSVRTINFTEGHKTFRYTIGLSGLEAVEPVAYRNAQDVVASSKDLVYLDKSGHYLHKIDAQNNISDVNSSQTLQAVKWSDPTFGVGQDENGHLYTVVNGSIERLKVPFSYGGKAVKFDVSSNRQIYAAYGSDIYKGTADGNFKKIFRATAASFVFAATTNKLAVFDEVGEENSAKPLVVVVDAADRVTKTSIDGEVVRLIWSPGGQYLVSSNESHAAVYDSLLRRIATLPADAPVSYVAWQNNDKFFYATPNEVWSFDTAGRSAARLASLPSVFGSITGLTISDDRSYLYMTTVDASSDSHNVIRRIGLKGQKAPDYVYRLQNVLPLTSADHSLSLINFAPPAAIEVESYPPSDLGPDYYLQQAQTELMQDGYDAGKFQFKLVQGG